MIHKVFKYYLVAGLFWAMTPAMAQTAPKDKEDKKGLENLDLKLEEKLKDLDLKLRNLDFDKLNVALADLGTKMNESFKNFGEDFSESFKNFNFQAPQFDTNYQTTEKTKTISKTYSVDSKDKLSIDNQYGDVVIKTWEKNQIKVDVLIKAFEGSDEEAQNLLDGVSINESRQNNLISFKTSISKGRNVWWGIQHISGKEQRRGVQVNYTVYMPSKNPLDVTNKYGNITVPEFDGVVNINSSYGSFSGKTLKNPANQIHVKYGSASIESLLAGNVNVAYGSLNVDQANQLIANVSYSSAKIGKLSGKGDVNIRYSGGFKIDEVDKNLKDLNIDASYSSVSLGFDPASSFDFDVTVNYAGFKFDDDKVDITSQTPDENVRGFKPSKNYKGRYGKGSDSKITIHSNYGSVKFL